MNLYKVTKIYEDFCYLTVKKKYRDKLVKQFYDDDRGFVVAAQSNNQQIGVTISSLSDKEDFENLIHEILLMYGKLLMEHEGIEFDVPILKHT